MFSNRLPPHAESNQLTRLLAELRGRGVPVTDLTASNPTTLGFPYPPTLLAPLADARALRYDPTPLGHPSARAAVAADYARRGVSVDPRHLVLSASTSEAYSWLFKLLCNPGDYVLIPRPSYPLFEHLTRLEGVRVATYELEYHGRWEVDIASLRAAPHDTRAVLAVTPNNPTGSYLSAPELEQLCTFCRERGCALVADEVFADYSLDDPHPLTDVAAHADVLAFSLGGLSKSVGLPQVKLGWMLVGGPPAARTAALAALELIADSFLSVGTPVQLGASELLRRAAPVRAAIQTRVRKNLEALRRAGAQFPACQVLRVEGGWSAVVRIPATRSEEQFVLDLLLDEQVLVHPGYFFDFAHEAFVVLSLLPEETRFADGVARVLRAAAA